MDADAVTDMDQEARNNNGVIITFREMYAELQRLVGELRDVNIAIKTHQKLSEDLEDRVRSLERWRYTSPIALITSVCSVIVAVILVYMKH